MAKTVNITHIESLLEKLSEKTGYPLNHHGFGKMSEVMNNEITQRYLYENLWTASRNSREANENTISLGHFHIDKIAEYLGYRDFDHFVKSLENPISSVLASVTGVYYCYVRKNAIEGSLLQSPVKIERMDNEITYLLKGAKRNYHGNMTYQEGCLFCTMTSGDKSFHHVYQIMKHESPEVLMGVFSGISTSGDPIGGRCVLIKSKEDFDDLTIAELSVDDLQKSTDINHQELAQYFETFEKNNLRVGRPFEFNIYDLNRD